MSICSPSNREKISTWTHIRGEVCNPVSRGSAHTNFMDYTGHILVLIPRNFRGAIHIRGRKNGHQILPALSMASRVLKSTHQENLILVGEPSPSTSGDGTDFLELRSRHGKITVGYTGDDAYQPDDTSFWQKIFGGGKA